MTARPSTPGSTRTGRGDAALALLDDITETALDPGYRARSGEPSRFSVALALVAVMVVAGAALGLALGGVRSTVVPDTRQARDVLEQRVRDRTDITDAAEGKVAALREQVAAGTSTDGEASSGESFALALAAASTPVQGPGVQVTLDDSERSTVRGDEDLGRVLDRDLQFVVNGLWAAGAEAIAINGQRLTATSAIRGAGEAILVDYRPLAPPYVVSAVGDPQELRDGFVAGPAGLALRTLEQAYGVRFEISTKESLALPAGSSSVLRLAVPVREAAKSGEDNP